MKKVKFETREVLFCPECNNEILYCDDCNVDLYIELGEKLDGYCKIYEHFCIECGKEGGGGK